MEKKIVLIGKSSSGKTELAAMLKEHGYKVGVSTTSRPIRPTETDGISYNFISRSAFETLIEVDEFIEWDEFNSWYYGLSVADYKPCDLLILTPRGLEKLIHKVGRENLIVIFMHTPYNIRFARSLSRGDDPIEINRRLKTDDADFSDYIESQDWDLSIDYRMADKFRFLVKLFSNFKN